MRFTDEQIEKFIDEALDCGHLERVMLEDSEKQCLMYEIGKNAYYLYPNLSLTGYELVAEIIATFHQASRESLPGKMYYDISQAKFLLEDLLSGGDGYGI